MSAFFIRSSLILILFFFGAVLGSLTGKHFLAIPIWFIAISAWTLNSGFRKSLWISIPFLITADVLWDGAIGALFLAGFVLATVTTYIAVRVEDRSSLLQMITYSLFIAFFSTLAVASEFFWEQSLPTFVEIKFLAGIFFWLLGTTLVFFFPVSGAIRRVEAWLDNSYREQTRKIR